jgi:hypothetical protein
VKALIFGQMTLSKKVIIAIAATIVAEMMINQG